MNYEHEMPDLKQDPVTSAWVDNFKGIIIVKGRTMSGVRLSCLGPDNKGFASKMEALAFAHQSTRKSASWKKENDRA